MYYYKVQPHNIIGDGPESLAVVAAPKEGQSVHISFDENGGDTAYDIWGGYHASLRDGAEWIESGRKGSAVALNKDQRSYISMPEGIVSELEDFTISTWVKFAGGKGRLFDFGNGTGTFMIGAVTSSQLRYKVIVGETGAVFDTRFNCSLPDDEWIHIAITQEDTSVKLYVNGYCMGEAINAQKVCPQDMVISKNN